MKRIRGSTILGALPPADSSAPRDSPSAVELKRAFETALRRRLLPETPVPAHPAAGPFAGSRFTPTSESAGDEATIGRLQKRIEGLIAAFGTSGRKWAGGRGVNQRDLFFLLSHLKNVAAGKSTISASKLTELAARFLNTEEAGQ